MNLLNFPIFCDSDQCQEVFGSQTAGLESWRQREVLGNSWYPRDWQVHGSSAGPRLLTEGRTLALALGYQLPSTTSLGAYRKWVNSGGNWDLCKTTTWRQKIGDLAFIYACLKWFSPARGKQAHLFPTHGTHFLWITPTLPSWNLESLLVLFTCTF